MTFIRDLIRLSGLVIWQVFLYSSKSELMSHFLRLFLKPFFKLFQLALTYLFSSCLNVNRADLMLLIYDSSIAVQWASDWRFFDLLEIIITKFKKKFKYSWTGCRLSASSTRGLRSGLNVPTVLYDYNCPIRVKLKLLWSCSKIMVSNF